MIGTIISAIVVGAIIGALARLVMPGKQNIGVIMTILLGIVGSFLGSWICYNLFEYSNEGGGWAVIPFIVGVVVAAVLIWAYVAIVGRRGTTVR
ncbi:GlsB/YeaQ/YmgE family stress response membrane protein [Mycobacterium hubeiense]|uniref:GlsB/YeaQ/YmgE family stress response membrane protein n=1 Tax=Mycobacterium hubeiense TaxID=1867256 RepID=UPI000C7F4108|nr:GlsB/YeaQ/YmgE family stress response membrane protein [Mycobacterium sp. QGD 101]